MSRAGNFNHAIAFKVAVNVVALNCRFNFVEVFKSQVFEQSNFVGEALLRVGNAMREA